MSYLIGRNFSIGIAKETTRGTAVAAQYWIPKMDVSIDDKINAVINDSSIAVIEDANNLEVATKYSQGSLSGLINDKSFGLFLLATLGTETTHALHAGETTVYDHNFIVAENVQHPSLTVYAYSANENLKFALGMIDMLEIDMEINKYCTYKVDFRANTNATATATPSYTSENVFAPQYGIVKFASTLSGLSAASAITLRKATIQIKKNIEEDWTIGSQSAADRLNKEFSIEGTIEVVYADRTYIDTILLAALVKAMRIQMVNTSVTIGSATNPTFTMDFATVKLSEVARKISNKDIIVQTIKFKAFYSLSDAQMVVATLTNTLSSAY